MKLRTKVAAVGIAAAAVFWGTDIVDTFDLTQIDLGLSNPFREGPPLKSVIDTNRVVAELNGLPTAYSGVLGLEGPVTVDLYAPEDMNDGKPIPGAVLEETQTAHISMNIPVLADGFASARVVYGDDGTPIIQIDVPEAEIKPGEATQTGNITVLDSYRSPARATVGAFGGADTRWTDIFAGKDLIRVAAGSIKSHPKQADIVRALATCGGILATESAVRSVLEAMIATGKLGEVTIVFDGDPGSNIVTGATGVTGDTPTLRINIVSDGLQQQETGASCRRFLGDGKEIDPTTYEIRYKTIKFGATTLARTL